MNISDVHPQNDRAGKYYWPFPKDPTIIQRCIADVMVGLCTLTTEVH
jgi:hypothetical protein